MYYQVFLVLIDQDDESETHIPQYEISELAPASGWYL